MPDYYLFTDKNGASSLRLFRLPFTEFVEVKANGKPFTMEDTTGKTKHITFKQDYLIGAYPVTQQLYEAIMGHNPSHFKGRHRPVEEVSWNDLNAPEGFLARMQARLHREYPGLLLRVALPSEAQWLYAAAGGLATDYTAYAGSNDLHDVGWFGVNNDLITMPIGLKQPNALGLYDMSGNVWEWCADALQDELSRLPSDGSAYVNTQVEARVLRGGSYFNPRGFALLRDRIHFPRGYRDRHGGFRLCLLGSPSMQGLTYPEGRRSFNQDQRFSVLR